MNIPEIIAELTLNDGVFPAQAMTEAAMQREAITPELLRILDDSTTNIAEIARQANYSGHVYALYLLAKFRENRAYKPIVDFVTSDQESVDLALGDTITEDLGRILASVCDGDTSLICGMVENADLDEFVRSAALTALVTLVAQGVKTRKEVMAYFLSLFHGRLEREFSVVWSCLVSCCCDLRGVAAAEEIERAFADDLIDPGYINRQDVRRNLERSEDQALTRIVDNPDYTFVNDPVREMAKWACYQTAQEPAKAPAREQYWKPAPVRTGPRVGRNEPCPCGSGKKYKKCCL